MNGFQNERIEIAPALPFDQGAPHINGPSVYGASPDRDFLYYIPVRGERPLVWSAEGELPPGLSLNADTGIISGRATEEGVWRLVLRAKNRLGVGTKSFRIEIAENHLARTPLMGWCSWNAHSTHVCETHIREAADLLCSTGLREFGYAFVNTDSCWQGVRENSFSAITPNPRFPDMSGMVSHIHRRGLKAGIYSTPMVHAWGSNEYQPVLPGSTGYPLNPDAFHPYFGGCGQVHFEEYDARRFAEWKFDYLKYDWPVCDAEYTRFMSDALRRTGRDFILSLTTGCNKKHIPAYIECANMCRASIDTLDEWKRLSGILFPDEGWLRFIGPGHWLDLDMLALGDISGITDCSWNRLTPNEQITHFAVWAFMASPLQLSCDLARTRTDSLAMALFSHEELLDIDQDELGEPPVPVSGDEHAKVYLRKLADGSSAAAFINAGEEPRELSLDLSGAEFHVRDVLARRDLGKTDGARISFLLPVHGTRIIRLSEEKN